MSNHVNEAQLFPTIIHIIKRKFLFFLVQNYIQFPNSMDTLIVVIHFFINYDFIVISLKTQLQLRDTDINVKNYPLATCGF